MAHLRLLKSKDADAFSATVDEVPASYLELIERFWTPSAVLYRIMVVLGAFKKLEGALAAFAHTAPQARTLDRGCHILTSAGIAVPVLQIAPGAKEHGVQRCRA